MAKILIISSNIHKTLAHEQREKCVALVKQSKHECQVEIMDAGTYEIPFVINSYHQTKPYDAYIALGLVLKTNLDHYDLIMSHIKSSFTHFALNHIIVGNGIVSATNLDELTLKIASSDPCLSAYASAFKAVDYLLAFKQSLGYI